MKKFDFLALSLAVLLGLVPSLPVFAVEAPQAASEHSALAASYEAKAQAQDALIAEHTQMKQDYKARFFVNEKVTPMSQIQKMDDHCNSIIQTAQKEKEELLDFAKWHRMRAAELQGR